MVLNDEDGAEERVARSDGNGKCRPEEVTATKTVSTYIFFSAFPLEL